MTDDAAASDRPPSRRLHAEGLISPHPFGERLPGPYAEDGFVQRFVSAFDEVLAPVLAVLDCLDAYWDPRLAPEDFLDWLATWVAAEADGGRPLADRRRAVARATELHRLRGTARGLAELLHAAFGVEARVVDSGGAAWSATPGGALPGSPEPSLVVRISADAEALPLPRLEALVEASRPAHVPCTVQVVPGGEAVGR
ncbi:phage tail protein [Streptomyces sp. SBT349]|uniref:phage tail protein n=1 Tax=Streptomyces sp. SBT349 TaxID=1580539 RepID=UPI00066C83FE|nr:phage tail protein [Streptomyces sp. SBT349]